MSARHASRHPAPETMLDIVGHHRNATLRRRHHRTCRAGRNHEVRREGAWGGHGSVRRGRWACEMACPLWKTLGPTVRWFLSRLTEVPRGPRLLPGVAQENWTHPPHRACAWALTAARKWKQHKRPKQNGVPHTMECCSGIKWSTVLTRVQDRGTLYISRYVTGHTPCDSIHTTCPER